MRRLNGHQSLPIQLPVVYNSNANARYGQDGLQTPGVQTATTPAQVNRVELDCRSHTVGTSHVSTDDDAYAASGLGVRAAHTGTGTDIGRGTGRQSAGVNTGGRAYTATPAARTCNDVRTIYPTYIVPSCSDGNADFFRC